MKAGFVDYLTWWGPYAVGVLALAYGIARGELGRRTQSSEPVDDPRLALPLAILAVASLVVGLILIGLLAGPRDLSWRFAAVFFVAGLLALVAYVVSHARAWTAPSTLFAGIGLALLEMAFLRNYFREAPMIYLFVAALGAWYVAAVVLYGGRRNGASALWAYALASVALSAAVSLGIYRYPRTAMGSLFAVDAAALCVLLAMLTSATAELGDRARSLVHAACAATYLALVGWLGSLLKDSIQQAPEGGLCVLVGAATVLLLSLLHRATAGADTQEAGAVSVPESSVLAVLGLAACTAASMRWLGGYGAALAGVGALASLPLACLLGHRQQASEQRPVLEVPLWCSVAAAALTAVALVRAFGESVSGRVALDVFGTYALPGLVLGGAAVLVPAFLSRAWAREDGSPLRAFLFGNLVAAASVAVVLAVAYFWRTDGTIGFVLGLAAGLFYTVLSAGLSGHSLVETSLAPGISLFSVVLVPSFLNQTLNLTRDQKVHVMMWVLGAVAVVMIAVSTLRVMQRGRQAAAARSDQG